MSAEDVFAQFFGGSSFGGMQGGGMQFGGLDGDSMGSMFGSQFQGHGRRQPSQAKPEIVKRALPCTLEELHSGFSKKLKITRNIQDSASGQVRQESHVLLVEGKPGWKAGTKLTFPGVRRSCKRTTSLYEASILFFSLYSVLNSNLSVLFVCFSSLCVTLIRRVISCRAGRHRTSCLRWRRSRTQP